MKIKVDLHIHSNASPCADEVSTPQAIVERALVLGLDAIALTDHDTTGNLQEFSGICAENNLKGLFGIEVTTKESIHVLSIFDTVEQALVLGVKISSKPSLDELERLVHADNGLVIPSHVDRQQNSLSSQLKQIPAGKNFDAIEFDKRNYFNQLKVPKQDYPVISNTDCHHLESLGLIYTEFEVEEISVAALRKALQTGCYSILTRVD